MTLPDLNVLLYAVNRSSPQHTQANAWLEKAFDDVVGVGLAWVVLLGFVRLSTRAGVMASPLAVDAALGVVDAWLNHPHARVLHPSERHGGILARLLLAAGTAGNLTTDAHLAALAIEHNARLTTFDRDFTRFAGLKYELLLPTTSN